MDVFRWVRELSFLSILLTLSVSSMLFTVCIPKSGDLSDVEGCLLWKKNSCRLSVNHDCFCVCLPRPCCWLTSPPFNDLSAHLHVRSLDVGVVSTFSKYLPDNNPRGVETCGDSNTLEHFVNVQACSLKCDHTFIQLWNLEFKFRSLLYFWGIIVGMLTWLIKCSRAL